MPYIDRDTRTHYNQLVIEMMRTEVATPGDLNFLITTLIDRTLADHGVNYSNINAAIGVLECAKLELYRRIAAPYEQQKISTNGDVFTTTTGENQ